MEVVTREYKVYNFSELSEDAKEKAKQWYLDDDFRPSEFTEIYEQDLRNDGHFDISVSTPIKTWNLV